MYHRQLFPALVARLREPKRFIQVLSGPRQVGKTMLARQALEALALPSLYASADDPTLKDRAWIAQQWEIGRLRCREGRGDALLVLDEIQKIPGWSETVKRLWDEDSAAGSGPKALLLGSAPLLVRDGLTESLAGRFEVIHAPHWSYAEIRDAFGWDVDRFVYFGGYPGAAPLAGDRVRWARYVAESLIETTVSRDILLLKRVDKPALLRRLFHLGCDYSGQVLAYQKMLGQLQDAGNTTTLAHYLDLLGGAGLLAGLPKFSGRRVLQRASSPKLQVLNPALATALSPESFDEARADGERWGRLVESAVGAHLLNGAAGTDVGVHYWRDRNREVDFVLTRGDAVAAIEVKSGRRPDRLPGMEAFLKSYPHARPLLVGAGGIPVEEFLLAPPGEWVGLPC